MSAEVAAAVDAALGSLLADKDVAEVAAVEGGLLEVVRRGRRERLGALLEGPLFALLRELGADKGVVRVVVGAGSSAGARLTAAPLVDGRVALCIAKAAPADVSLAHLVEEQVLPPGIDAELVAAVREGAGVAIIGPARAARSRVAVALARALASSLRIVSVGHRDGPAGVAGVTPSPLSESGTVADRAAVAVDIGADVLLALDISAAEAAGFPQNLAVPVIAAVASPSMAALSHEFLPNHAVKSAFAVVVVIGFGPDGRPRLVEMHGGVGDAPPLAPTPIAPTPLTTLTPLTPTTVAPPSMSKQRVATLPGLSLADVPVLDVQLGDGPPADWASSDLDDDPGWELGNLASNSSSNSSSSASSNSTNASGPPSPGSFDAVLQSAARASAKPQFVPKQPPPHPQAASLKGTGGLTFEPPPPGPSGGGSDE